MNSGLEQVRAVLATHAGSARGVVVGEGVGHAGITSGMKGNLLLTPLSEVGSVGAATGMALAGKHPVVELIDPTGLARAGEALADLGGLAARSNGTFSAAIVVLVPLSPACVLPRLPAGVSRVVVGRAVDMGPAVGRALASSEPTVVAYAASALNRVEGEFSGTVGEPLTLREGQGVVVLTEGEGVAVGLACEAAATVVDLRGCRNPKVLGGLIGPSGRVVFCTHDLPGSFLEGITEAFWRLEAPPLFVPPAAGTAALAFAISASLTA